MIGAHHALLIRVHLDHVAILDRSIAAVEDEIAAALEAIPAAWGVDQAGEPARTPARALRPARRRAARRGPRRHAGPGPAIIAETGLDMSAFPTAGHLVSWAGLAPVTRQSGPAPASPRRARATPTSRATAPRPPTAPPTPAPSSANGSAGSQAHRPARAKCAVARSILVIVWHLLRTPPPATTISELTGIPQGQHRPPTRGHLVRFAPSPRGRHHRQPDSRLKLKSPLTRPATQYRHGPLNHARLRQ